jgi:dynein heavy chain
MIDWFHPWPEEALISVANKYLSESGEIEEKIQLPVARFMAYAHEKMDYVSQQYMERERRCNYTTPKSFLELINLYVSMLSKKKRSLRSAIDRLELGLAKLRSSHAQVDELKVSKSSRHCR